MDLPFNWIKDTTPELIPLNRGKSAVEAFEPCTTPIAEMARIEENTVYLKLDKKSVKSLPTIPLKS